MRKMNVAIVGATGAVGTQMIKLLENSTLPIGTVKFFGFEALRWEATFI